MSSVSSAGLLEQLRAVVEKYWGYTAFRPLQQEAMEAMLAARDSLVVLPTGGGKSLCYQAPAVVRSANGGGVTVVVSPLIALMKDQVDSLRANGVPAAQLDSSLSAAERRTITEDVRSGAVTLLFVSPERLVMEGFQDFLREAGVRCFAIDEAHCISHWGHDFRPEYRRLGELKTWFPGASVHAFTATATAQVRADIVAQLGLEEPQVLVGNFDRPNLTYRVVQRLKPTEQVVDFLNAHKDEPGIIYCIRRKDVDELAATLTRKGFKALPYHAGMTPDQRRRTQEAFAAEECDLIIATVAFGMGIDRSNIRFVLHTAMPKSIEAYQQETGRAGRDGLEAHCVLLYSAQDAMLWKSIIERSAAEATDRGEELDPEYVPSAMRHVDDMDRFARGAVCRHQALVEYFGQTYEPPVKEGEEGGDGSCGACDLCLGQTASVDDALVIAQKLLSCVARTGERFGAGHLVSVVRGENTERVRQLGHDRLPTFGLLKEHDKNQLRDWLHQLVGQKALVQELVSVNGQQYPVFRLNRASWEVMKGQREVRLVQTVKAKAAKRSKEDVASWEGVDRELFQALRAQRKQMADEAGVPPYVVFSDATLRHLARVRPSTMEGMRGIYGIGERKLRDYAPRVLPIIVSHCEAAGLSMDNAGRPREATAKRFAIAVAEPTGKPPHPTRVEAFKLFERGASLDDVSAQLARSRNTVVQYLVEWITATGPASIGPWVPEAMRERVLAAAREVGGDKAKPVYVALGETVGYDEIRIVLAHARVNTTGASQ